MILACSGSRERAMPSGRLRVVCLTPSSTEIVAEIGALDLIVGVDSFSQYPAEARALPKVGTFLSPSQDAILALAPDIVVIDAIYQLRRRTVTCSIIRAHHGHQTV